jgi:hypothetical protein
MKWLLHAGSLGLVAGLLGCLGGSTLRADEGKVDRFASFREHRGQVTWTFMIGEKPITDTGTYEVYRDPAVLAGWSARIQWHDSDRWTIVTFSARPDQGRTPTATFIDYYKDRGGRTRILRTGTFTYEMQADGGFRGGWWLTSIENFDGTLEPIPDNWGGVRPGVVCEFVPER